MLHRTCVRTSVPCALTGLPLRMRFFTKLSLTPSDCRARDGPRIALLLLLFCQFHTWLLLALLRQFSQ